MKVRIIYLAAVLITSWSPFSRAADCNYGDLLGDWTIFHKAVPKADLHLDVDSTLSVRRQGMDYIVELEDKSGWKVVANPATYFCNSDGKVILLTSIVKDDCTHQVALMRVTNSDLAYHHGKKAYPPNQIEFYQFGHLGTCREHLAKDGDEKEEIAPNSADAVHAKNTHPGHIHGDKD